VRAPGAKVFVLGSPRQGTVEHFAMALERMLEEGEAIDLR